MRDLEGLVVADKEDGRISTSTTEPGVNTSYEHVKSLLNKMREEGRPINSMEEYRAFVNSDGDADADASRRTRLKTVEELVSIAEQLATEHGGALPRRTWLPKNGYMGLHKALQRHPHLFEHIAKAGE